LSCSKVYERAEIHKIIKEGTKVPRCSCGGILKPGTIFFGEPLKPDVVQAAKAALEECDLLIVMGTSLLVQPANKLPQICLSNGVPLAIINLDETQYDQYSTVVIHQPSGDTMKLVLEKLNSMNS